MGVCKKSVGIMSKQDTVLKWQLREQQEAEDRALSELKYMAELGIKVGDTSYLQSMGFDTSYLDRYNDLTLQEKQASLLKRKRAVEAVAAVDIVLQMKS